MLLLSACQSEQANQVTMQLNGDWEFKAVDEDTWRPATVPGSVHTDLLANELIEDPFYRTNERDLQWIDKKQWEYRTVFELEKSFLHKTEVELLFEGLDTYARVFLNDQLLLETDNMFRRYRSRVKDLLREGPNELRVVFDSPVAAGLRKYADQGYVIPVSDNDQSEVGGLGDKKVSIYTRKAGYHYGWDWGPRFVTSGIWRPVKIQAWNEARFRDLRIDQQVLSDAQASLLAVAEVEAVAKTAAEMEVFVNGVSVRRLPVDLAPGDNTLSVDFTIDDPQRWWPNGLGEQPLYDVELRLEGRSGSPIASRTQRIGLRTVEVVQQPDSAGSSFVVEVNGHPVFMKGANYIPQDNFLNRVTPERYEHVLQSAADANMNMIRIWGGGIYEEDIFYELCDEKGLLVWQDFMFACAMYPGDDAFLENVRQEAIDNVRRLRHHPSVALWCGNNEILSAWYNWGWRDRVAREQGQEVADAIWHAYDTLFHELLPGVVDEYDPARFYWASSPAGGPGQPENWVAGDVHYWGVWWGQEPFSRYEELIPRFMSEFGFQSFPELSTIEQFAEPEDYDIYSEVLKAHQRSSIGNGTIANYMARDYRQPKDFEHFLYVGQILQAEGIRIGIEAHRRNMPYCMGSLYWQLDDCWPVASWSSMDYYGNWKALQYAAKKAFAEVLVSPKVEEGELRIYIVSDKLQPVKAQLDLRLLDFAGDLRWQYQEGLQLAANQSQVYARFPADELLAGQPLDRLVLQAVVRAGEQPLAENLLYFTPPKALELPAPLIAPSVEAIAGAFRIQLRSEVLAKNVYLQVADVDGFFSDNYFDLLPGETKTLTFRTGTQVDDLPQRLQITTLVDSYTTLTSGK